MKPVSKYTLGEVCTVVSGGTPKRSVREYWEGGDIPWVKISDLGHGSIYHTEERITRKGLDNSAAKLLPSGAVIVSIFATIGATGILATPACTNQAIAGVVPKESSGLTPRYIYYWPQSQRQFMEGTARGVAQNNINLSVLRSMEIPLYSKPEQRRISDVLAHVDALLNDCKKLLNTLDKLVKSRFIEMFGTVVSRAERWETHSLDSVVSIIGGYAFKSSKYSEGGTRIIRISNVQDGFIEDKSPAYYSESDMRGLERYLLQEGDLLMSLTGNVGRVGLLQNDLLPAALNQRVACLREKRDSPDRQRVNMRYLYEYFRSNEFQGMAEAGSSGVAQKNMSMKWLSSLDIAMPPIHFQEQFADFANQVDKLRFDALSLKGFSLRIVY